MTRIRRCEWFCADPLVRAILADTSVFGLPGGRSSRGGRLAVGAKRYAFLLADGFEASGQRALDILIGATAECQPQGRPFRVSGNDHSDNGTLCVAFDRE